jgi:L-ornithine N5-oxygenase
LHLTLSSVNEIFDPDRVDGIFSQDATARAASLTLDRGTNYGVVRIELLEHLYEKLYMQRMKSHDQSTWRCRIIPNRVVVSAESAPSSAILLRFAKRDLPSNEEIEELETDYVFAATGYRRNVHEDMLRSVRDLVVEEQGKMGVRRDYGVKFQEGKVDDDAGVWLQGCNEGTHGVSF